MPYSKVEGHDECEGQWGAVVKDDNGEVMGCHDTEESANAQLAALNAAEDDDDEMEGEKSTVVNITINTADNVAVDALKAGRVLSKATAKQILAAYTALGSVLERAGVDIPGVGQPETGEPMDVAGVKKFQEQSFDEKQRRVRDTWYSIYRNNQAPMMQSDDCWVKEVFEGRVIIETSSGLWEYPYTLDSDGNIQFGEGIRVEIAYTPVKTLTDADLLITHGGTIKALGNGKVGGYLVRFSTDLDPDLENEFFTRETDFDIQFPAKSSVYFHHGLDPTIRKRRLGNGKAEMTLHDEFGVWVEAQLDLRDRYEKFIYGRCKENKMGWSSGTVPNLVEVTPQGKAGWIKTWPLGLDASITPTPAEPRAKVETLKSYAAASKAVDFSSVETEETAEGPESEGMEAEKLNEIRERLNLLKSKRGI